MHTSTTRSVWSGWLARVVTREPVPWRLRGVVGITVALLIALSAGLVYATGGTQHAWLHLLYVPVLAAAWAFGPAGGVVAGLAAGLAVGPGMPVDVDAGMAQATTNWLYRLGFLVLIGGVSGGLHQLVRTQLAESRAERRRFASLAENASDVVLAWDAAGLVVYASPSVTRVLGHPVDAVVGQPFGAFVHGHDSGTLRRLLSARTTEPWTRTELRVRHADGSWRHLEAVVNNLLGDPDVAAVVCNGRDVTGRRAMESELRHQAWHDAATGLPNRGRFTQLLAEAVERARTDGGRGPAVLMIHLDRFRGVLESIGPDSGELLMTALGQRLSGMVGPGDHLARIATTEFAVLCERVHDPGLGLALAERFLHATEEPFLLADGEVHLSTSIGVALAGDADHDVAQLVRDAHTAAHHASGSGSRAALLQIAWRDAAASALDTETALHSALDRSQFTLCYQPIIDLRTGRPLGSEALIRWHHPRLGTVPPTDFIPVAEQTGMIEPIGRWVLQTACEQAARWRQELGRDDLAVSVNISARQLDSTALIDDVTRALDSTGFPPATLTLELTETALLGDTPQTIDALAAIKALGVRLAIDDFGTGYSSLGYLKRLPVDILKIDRLFVSQLGHADGDDAIVSAIIGLARTLGLVTTAEGVEESAQGDRLVELGCDHAQGYLYGRPGPAEAVTPLLASPALGAADPA